MTAGMGSRHDGLKQIDSIDEHGDKVIDFPIYDTVRVGFKKVIFIIKKVIEKEFKEQIGDKISKHVQIEHAYQELDKTSAGCQIPEGREKPWGTGHVTLCYKDAMDRPLAVINANDYYGKSAFQSIYDQLSTVGDDEKYQYTMVDYKLYNTLTENRHAARGVCGTDENSELTNIHERARIGKHGERVGYAEDGDAIWMYLPEETVVSMNMWGLTVSMLEELDRRFAIFLDREVAGSPLKCERFFPFTVNELLKGDKAEVIVLKSVNRWHRATYKGDKETAARAIQDSKSQGSYPDKLWED